MATGSRHDPLASFNFIVTVENMRAGFSEVGGLATETDIIEYREGSEDITARKLPGKRKYTNISLKRGYTPDGKDMWAWRKTVMDGKTVRKGGTITLLDEARKPAITWEFSEGWPSKWAGPAFNAKNNDIAIEEMEICIEGLALQTDLATIVTAAYRTPGVYVEWLDASSQQLDIVRTDVAGFVGIAERGPVQRPTKIESAQQFLSTFGKAVPQAYLAYAVAGFFANGGRTCWVVRAANPTGARYARVTIRIEGRDQLPLRATSEGAWGNAVRIEPIWQGDTIVRLRATTPDDRQQEIALRDPESRDIERRVQTNLLGVRDQALQELQTGDIVERDPDMVPGAPVVTLAPGACSASLSGGADGLDAVTLDHFTGDPNRIGEWGVASLERINGIAFVAVPDLMVGQRADPQDAAATAFDPGDVTDAQIRIINSCMGRRDRIAILDLPPVDRRAAIACKKQWPETSYAAVYHPWIVVDDPLALRAGVRAVPPSGHVAGMYARTDRLRGVHKPPANETLEGVWDLTEALDSDAHGELNDNGVNAIRAMPGRGILVLGARTLHFDVRWRYVNVRRLFAMIEDTLDEQMNWLTFEPNNPALWRQIDRAVRGFLERLYRAGMLDGATSDDAYRVRCDDSTNPPEQTDEGRVTCVIGVQPPYPAEFVVVRIGVTRSGIEVEEKGAQDV